MPSAITHTGIYPANRFLKYRVIPEIDFLTFAGTEIFPFASPTDVEIMPPVK
jgi:hypothetical protein